MKYYREEAEQVLSELGSSETGLTQDEAARRLAQNGRNRLETAKGKSLLRRFFDQLADPMTLVLLAAAAVMAIGLGMYKKYNYKFLYYV